MRDIDTILLAVFDVGISNHRIRDHDPEFHGSHGWLGVSG